MKDYPLNNVKKIYSVREMLEYRAQETPSAIAFKYMKKKSLITVSYRELMEQVRAFGTYLIDSGFSATKIAIMGENSYNWLLAEFSIMCSGNVSVPLDKEYEAKKAAEILMDSGSSILIFSDSYVEEAEEIQQVCREKNYSLGLINMKAIASMLESGMSMVAAGNNVFEQTKINSDLLATIVYTSGTTGKSKGVMLSHGNLAADTYGACSIFYVEDTFLVLPLHHMFGLVAGVFVALLYGRSVFINSSLKRLSSELVQAQPTTLFLVPVFVETLYKNIWRKVDEQGKTNILKRLIKVSNVLLKIGIDVRKVLFKSVRAGFGGNVTGIISGGAPLNLKYIQGFRDFGIELFNGYGITECAPVVSVNRNNYYRDGSVGQIVAGCQVKIEKNDNKLDGEVWVRGPIVMMGYHNKPEETALVMDGEWFDTGDIGHLDDDGFLFITGRKKNLIILDNGENVSPEEIESKLLELGYILEVVVFEGDDKIIAEVYPDFESASKDGVEDVREYIRKKILENNYNFPSYMQIKKVQFRDCEFEKNTTKKILRFKVEETV